MRILTAVCGLDRGSEHLYAPPSPEFSSWRGMRVTEQNRYAAWRALIVVMGILLLIGGQKALAVCTFNGTSEATFVLPATITVSRTAAVGDVLYRSPDLRTQPGISLNCTDDIILNQLHAEYLIPVQEIPGMVSTYHGFQTIFQTNIPGIGVKVSVTTRRPDIRPLINGVSGLESIFGVGLFPNHTEDLQVELIFTGVVSPGTLSFPSPLARIYFHGEGGLFARLLTSGTTQVIAPGCSVDNDNIVVRLPTISSANLNGIDAIAGATRFAIALTCHSSTSVAYQIEGTSATGMAHLGVLANRTSAGDATGVGVQLLAGSPTTPVILDNTLSPTFITTTSDNQPVSIPFVARYYRTSATMTAGTVWARVTFTMDYQ